MNILKISSFYPFYLEEFYSKHTKLQHASYREQLSKLNYDAFGWADFWSTALEDSDHSMIEVTANNEHLQKAWAREHNFSSFSENWYEDILFQQVKAFKPDVLFFEDRNISQNVINLLKTASPNIHQTIAWCGTPFESLTEFNPFDTVIGCIPDLNEQLSASGIQTFLLNHAFDPRILDRIPRLIATKFPITFIGQVLNKQGMHSKRTDYLSALAQETEINIFSPQNSNGLYESLLQQIVRIVWPASSLLQNNGALRALAQSNFIGQKLLTLEKQPPSLPKTIRNRTNQAVFGLEMFATLKQSAISFNIHIEASKKSASNMRLFEATGVGSCLLTDKKDNLGEFFKENSEVITYESIDDCLEKIEWLNNHPDKRTAISRRGQERTLSFHTFRHRAKDFSNIMRRLTL